MVSIYFYVDDVLKASQVVDSVQAGIDQLNSLCCDIPFAGFTKDPESNTWTAETTKWDGTPITLKYEIN